MIDAADSLEHVALLALCGYCGLRVSEACEVEPKHIDFERMTLTVALGKGDQDRHVPLSSAAAGYLAPAVEAARRTGQRTVVGLTESGARKAVRRYGRAADIGRAVSSHDLRATLATAAYVASGHNLRAVQEILGHAKSETTEVYTGVTEGEMRRALEL